MDGTLCAPTKDGWGDGCYVVVLSTKATSDPNGATSEADASFPVSNAPSVGELSYKIYFSVRNISNFLLELSFFSSFGTLA